MIRVISRCLRFIHNSKNKNSRQLTKHLKTDEMNDARDRLIKLIKNECFIEDIERVKRNNQVNKKSKLIKLSPFLDKGILRVSFRLCHSN